MASRLYNEVRRECVEALSMHQASVLRLGQALIKADKLEHGEYLALMKDLAVNEKQSEDFLEAAKRFAAGELDIRLAGLGNLTASLMRRLTKKTQQRLLNEKLPLLVTEDEVGEKSIFEMTLAEVKQVLTEEGVILRPDQQKVGGVKKKREREPKLFKATTASFSFVEGLLTFKSEKAQMPLNIDTFTEELRRRGELEKFEKALTRAKQKGKAIYDPDEDVA